MPAVARKVIPADLLSDADYAKVRKERRAALLPLKRLRRVELGPICTFFFESLIAFTISFAFSVGIPCCIETLCRTVLDAAGPNTAVLVGTEARIEIDRTWYFPTSFSLIAPDGTVIERFVHEVPGRGMQFQADELERLVAAGQLAGTILPPAETVAIMGTLDEIRRQIGLRYPGE